MFALRCQFEMAHVSSHSRRNCLVCASAHVCVHVICLCQKKEEIFNYFPLEYQFKWKIMRLGGVLRVFFSAEFIYLQNHRHHSILNSKHISFSNVCHHFAFFHWTFQCALCLYECIEIETEWKCFGTKVAKKKQRRSWTFPCLSFLRVIFFVLLWTSMMLSIEQSSVIL